MYLYDDRTIDTELIRSLNIVMIGYGNQGRAQALNLRDSGVGVTVALRAHSASEKQVEQDGLKHLTIRDAVAEADLLLFMAPDEHHKSIFEDYIKPHMKPGVALLFAHGLSIHFKQILPPDDVDIILVSPKGPGTVVRSRYEAGQGVPCLLAVEQDFSGRAEAIALSYAAAIGADRAGIVRTSFKEECETDLFGEQVVLCGGLSHLIMAAYDTLVEAGYAPEMAYFECVHEVKQIADLIFERGIADMRVAISNTAEFGDYVTGPKIIDGHVRANMKKALDEIRSGAFVHDLMRETEENYPRITQERQKAAGKNMENVGRSVRALMPWLQEKQ